MTLVEHWETDSLAWRLGMQGLDLSKGYDVCSLIAILEDRNYDLVAIVSDGIVVRLKPLKID